MKKLNKTLAIASIVMASFIQSPSNAADIKFFKEIEAGYRYEPSLVEKVSNIPFEVRNVPNHKDDYQGSQGAIEQDDLSPSDRLSFGGVRAGLKANIFEKRAFVKTGLGLDVNMNSQRFLSPDDRKDIAERNYQGNVGTEDRSTGAALTYIYAGTGYFSEWNTIVRPYVFGETGVNLSKSISLTLGARATEQKYFLENGWDRYGKFDVKDKFPLAEYFILTPYVSLKKRFDDPDTKNGVYFSLEAGVSKIISESKTQMGREVEMKMNENPYFIGLKFELDF